MEEDRQDEQDDGQDGRHSAERVVLDDAIEDSAMDDVPAPEAADKAAQDDRQPGDVRQREEGDRDGPAGSPARRPAAAGEDDEEDAERDSQRRGREGG